jgi:hypothetical protein
MEKLAVVVVLAVSVGFCLGGFVLAADPAVPVVYLNGVKVDPVDGVYKIKANKLSIVLEFSPPISAKELAVEGDYSVNSRGFQNVRKVKGTIPCVTDEKVTRVSLKEFSVTGGTYITCNYLFTGEGISFPLKVEVEG